MILAKKDVYPAIDERNPYLEALFISPQINSHAVLLFYACVIQNVTIQTNKNAGSLS
jgi:hypothetical protein